MTLPALNASGYVYRPLKTGIQGWDVWALQSALSIPKDGLFGPQTEAAVRACQQRNRLTEDGIAGPATQREATLDLVWPVQRTKGTPPGLLRGQIEHESSFWVGNHSPRYPDGSFDVGVCQRNTRYVSYTVGFDAPGSVTALANNLVAYHDKFAGVADARRWGLAAGAWNAPSWACWIARSEGATGVSASETSKPSDSQRATLEAYIADVERYVT